MSILQVVQHHLVYIMAAFSCLDGWCSHKILKFIELLSQLQENKYFSYWKDYQPFVTFLKEHLYLHLSLWLIAITSINSSSMFVPLIIQNNLEGKPVNHFRGVLYDLDQKATEQSQFGFICLLFHQFALVQYPQKLYSVSILTLMS